MIATHESFAHDYHKRRLVAARAGDTVLTEDFHVNWPPHAAVRVLRNSVTRGERGDRCGHVGAGCGAKCGAGRRAGGGRGCG